jgi:hypothetical protein
VLGGAALGGLALRRGGPPEPSPEPPVTPAAVARYAAEYSEEVRETFFDACPRSHQLGYCHCLWSAMQENIPWATFVEIDRQLTADPESVNDTPLARYQHRCEADFPSPRPTVSSSPRRR